MWWDAGRIFDTERDVAEAGDPPQGEVVFGIGGLETDAGRRPEGSRLPDGHPFKPPAVHLDMVDDLEWFVASLRTRSHDGLDIHVITLAEEFHATVSGVVLTRGLRRLYRN